MPLKRPPATKKSKNDDLDDGRQMMEEWLASWDGTVDKDLSEEDKPLPAKDRKTPQASVDLHGLTVRDANDKLDQAILRKKIQHGELQFKIITGRGIHSSGQPVLVTEVYNHVQRCYSEFIVSVDSSPMDTIIGGLPLRGWFNVHFKFR